MGQRAVRDRRDSDGDVSELVTQPDRKRLGALEACRRSLARSGFHRQRRVEDEPRLGIRADVLLRATHERRLRRG